MTTNTTNSQAPKILAKQVAEWLKEVARLNDLIAHAEGRDSQAASIDTPEFRKRLRALRNYTIQEAMDTEMNEICDDIDAKLAQAREEGEQYQNLTCQTLKEHNMQLESRLAEIQRGVEGMANPYMNGSRYFSLWEIHHKQFLALLQPQGQADTK